MCCDNSKNNCCEQPEKIEEKENGCCCTKPEVKKDKEGKCCEQ